MTDSLLAPSREVLYKWYHTGEHVPATILEPSDDSDDFVRPKYSRNWRDYENPSTRALNGLGISCLGMCYFLSHGVGRHP